MKAIELIRSSEMMQKEIAYKLGVSPQRLNNWLRRGKVDVEFLLPLSKILNVRADKLL